MSQITRKKKLQFTTNLKNIKVNWRVVLTNKFCTGNNYLLIATGMLVIRIAIFFYCLFYIIQIQSGNYKEGLRDVLLNKPLKLYHLSFPLHLIFLV